MPAPVVYVLAIVGTVGAVLAFKEFVYEPHIAPAFDRWKEEYLAAREAKRREKAMEAYQDQSEMSVTRRKSKGRSSDKYSDEDSSDDEDDQDHGKRAATSSHSFMRDGLLLRRPNLVAKNNSDVELDNLLAREVNEWRNESNGQALRHRKNVLEHAMDESIQAVPYAPLSPSRTHVIFDSAAPSPSTPSTQRELPSLPSTPAMQKVEVLPTGTKPPGSPLPQERKITPSPVTAPQEPLNFTQRSVSNVESASRSSSMPSLEPNLMDTGDDNDDFPSPPPEVTPFPHMVTQSTLLGRTPSLPPTFNVPSSSIPVYTPTHPLQHSYHQVVPSLSQSYPQELDYEHDLELLSPPSSRSDSPFSMAALSPNSNARALGPFNSMGSHSVSGFSSGVSSPSPLRMSLGNQSYDAISPIQQFQSMSPFLDPPSDNMSATHSARSTTYLSFGEDGSDDEHAQSYANLGASIGFEGTLGPTSTSQTAQPQPQSPPQPQPQQMDFHQPTVLHPSFLHGPYSNSPSPRDTSRIAHIAPTMGHMGSESTLTPDQVDEGLGLGLILAPTRDARTPSAPSSPLVYVASHTANAGVDVGRGAGDPAYFRPSLSAGAAVLSPVAPSSSLSYRTAATTQAPHTPAQSDSELSDLDFMSDYTQSSSDLGNESDSGWSLASEPVNQGQGYGSLRAGGAHTGRGGSGAPRGGGGARTMREAQGGRLWRA